MTIQSIHTRAVDVLDRLSPDTQGVAMRGADAGTRHALAAASVSGMLYKVSARRRWGSFSAGWKSEIRYGYVGRERNRGSQ
jgi:hypothetical protein